MEDRALPAAVPEREWRASRADLLKREKELTRLRDEVAASLLPAPIAHKAQVLLPVALRAVSDVCRQVIEKDVLAEVHDACFAVRNQDRYLRCGTDRGGAIALPHQAFAFGELRSR